MVQCEGIVSLAMPCFILSHFKNGVLLRPVQGGIVMNILFDSIFSSFMYVYSLLPKDLIIQN